MEDLGRSDILVVNGDSEGACGVGIESTVAKIDVDNNRIVILRMGGVTRAELQGTLALGGEEFEEMCVVAGSIAGGKITPESDHEAGSGSEHASASDAEGQAPGRFPELCTLLHRQGRISRTVGYYVSLRFRILQDSWTHYSISTLC